MIFRRRPFPLRVVALATVLLVSVAGCPKDADRRKTPADTAAATKKPDPAASKKKPPGPTLPDQNGDTAFLAFVGRLRQAVAAKDAETIAGMMPSDFLYLPDPTPEDPGSGRGVFAYWERNNLWSELNLVLHERFVPYGSLMVAPPEFAVQENNYHGYRAGLALVNGGWKFVYFIKD